MRPLILFTLDGSRFGLDASVVQEVVRAVAIAPVPSANPLLEGAVDVRGNVVPVLDIRFRLDFPPAVLAPSQFLIIARAGERLCALRVDDVLEFATVRAADIAAAMPGAQYTAGIVRHPDGLVIINDLAAFLSLDEGRQVDEALAR
jgi:purine-binding chemotaxis protein CheW